MIKLLEVHIPARKSAKIDSGIRKLFKLIKSDTKTAESGFEIRKLIKWVLLPDGRRPYMYA